MPKVWLVGAGPGAPDLLTVRALRLIERADILFHDALVLPETLALAKHARLVDVGKRNGKVSTEQRFINRAIVEAARSHATVVRLKGGDPMLFGRAQEEIDALGEAGIEVEVVPGITAALAASAELGVSLTRRGVARTVAFATPRVGREQEASDWLAAAAAADTAVLYMASGQASNIARALIDAGKPPDTPVALVECASLPESHHSVGTLGELAHIAPRFHGGPAVLCVGRVFDAAHGLALAEDAQFPESRVSAGRSR
jgi:uroporphyrin-III C-methyltransferase